MISTGSATKTPLQQPDLKELELDKYFNQEETQKVNKLQAEGRILVCPTIARSFFTEFTCVLSKWQINGPKSMQTCAIATLRQFLSKTSENSSKTSPEAEKEIISSLIKSLESDLEEIRQSFTQLKELLLHGEIKDGQNSVEFIFTSKV